MNERCNDRKVRGWYGYASERLLSKADSEIYNEMHAVSKGIWSQRNQAIHKANLSTVRPTRDKRSEEGFKKNRNKEQPNENETQGKREVFRTPHES